MVGKKISTPYTAFYKSCIRKVNLSKWGKFQERKPADPVFMWAKAIFRLKIKNFMACDQYS